MLKITAKVKKGPGRHILTQNGSLRLCASMAISILAHYNKILKKSIIVVPEDILAQVGYMVTVGFVSSYLDIGLDSDPRV